MNQNNVPRDVPRETIYEISYRVLIFLCLSLALWPIVAVLGSFVLMEWQGFIVNTWHWSMRLVWLVGAINSLIYVVFAE